MSDPYIGEIRMFGGSFAPQGWLYCDGSLQSISANTALYNLVGTTYGGDGVNTFGLPDLRGRTPIHVGQGYVQGQLSGSESVTLTANQLPAHNHTVAATDSGQVLSPAGALPAVATSTQAGVHPYNNAVAANVQMDASRILPSGGSQPHDNMQPFLCVSYIIAVEGIYPSQN